MLRAWRWLGIILLTVVLVVLPSAVQSLVGVDVGGSQQQLLSLVNQTRKQGGLAALALDDRLCQAAHLHAQLMAEHRHLSHDFSGELQLRQRLAASGVHFDAVAENVADAGSVADAHVEFMHSSGHRANILNPRYNAVGLAIVPAPNGHLYITEDFAHRLPEFSEAQLEQLTLDGMNQLRSRHALPFLQVVPVSMLQHEACRNKVNASALAHSISSVGWVVVFTGSDPHELPEEITKIAGKAEARGVALGACFPPNDENGYAMFQMIAIFFRRAEP